MGAAERLVERNGFSGTSVEAIIRESKSSKGAFFHHFATKRALAHALVTRYVEADLELLRAGLEVAATESDPVAKVLAFLDFYENWSGDLTAESACLYIAVVTERDLLDQQTAAEIERAITTWRDALSGLLGAAYAHRGLRGGPDPDDLADQLFVVFEGSYLVCRALGSGEPMRAQLRVFRQLVQALLA